MAADDGVPVKVSELDYMRAVPRTDPKGYLKQAMKVSGSDPVNSPSHYTDGGIETIDFIEAKGLNYLLGNAVKYISRMGKKVFDGSLTLKEQKIQDLEKAVWYLQREIKTLKGK